MFNNFIGELRPLFLQISLILNFKRCGNKGGNTLSINLRNVPLQHVYFCDENSPHYYFLFVSYFVFWSQKKILEKGKFPFLGTGGGEKKVNFYYDYLKSIFHPKTKDINN